MHGAERPFEPLKVIVKAVELALTRKGAWGSAVNAMNRECGGTN
jgi:hypothetical protein